MTSAEQIILAYGSPIDIYKLANMLGVKPNDIIDARGERLQQLIKLAKEWGKK